jgi:hypothetical protein
MKRTHLVVSALSFFCGSALASLPENLKAASYDKERAVVVGNQLLHLDTITLNPNETISIVITGGKTLMNFTADCATKKGKYTSIYVAGKLMKGSDSLSWENALDTPRGGNMFTAPYNVLCSSLVVETLHHASPDQ